VCCRFVSIIIFIAHTAIVLVYFPYQQKIAGDNYEENKKYLTINQAVEIIKLDDKDNEIYTVERVVLYDHNENVMQVFPTAFEKEPAVDRYIPSLYYVKNETNRTLRNEIVNCGSECKDVHVVDGDEYETKEYVYTSYLLGILNKVGSIFYVFYK